MVVPEQVIRTSQDNRTKKEEMMNITGLIHITGEHDTGKTTLALACDVPSQHIAFIDDDIKGRATVKQIGAENFGLYVDFVKRCEGKKEIEQHEAALEIIKQIEGMSLKLEVVVWDTWTRIGKSCHAYVKKYPNKFRDSYAASGVIKGAEIGAEGNRYEAELLDRLLEAVPLVIVTTHLREQRKQVSENQSVRTGKLEPDARKAIEEKSNLRIWLRHNPKGVPQPIGLTLKRPIKWQRDPETGKIKPINVLPRKINPCTWEMLNNFWEHPMGDRLPTPEEMPDEFELSILDGTLTPDQKKVFEASLLATEEEVKEQTTIIVPTPSDNGNTELHIPALLRAKQSNGDVTT